MHALSFISMLKVCSYEESKYFCERSMVVTVARFLLRLTEGIREADRQVGGQAGRQASN